MKSVAQPFRQAKDDTFADRIAQLLILEMARCTLQDLRNKGVSAEHISEYEWVTLAQAKEAYSSAQNVLEARCAYRKRTR